MFPKRDLCENPFFRMKSNLDCFRYVSLTILNEKYTGTKYRYPYTFNWFQNYPYPQSQALII